VSQLDAPFFIFHTLKMSAANIFMLVSKLFKMEQRKTGKRKTYCWKEEGETLRKKKIIKAINESNFMSGKRKIILNKA